jgi:hypothetical protein
VTVEAGFRDDDPVLAGHAAASLAKSTTGLVRQ